MSLGSRFSGPPGAIFIQNALRNTKVCAGTRALGSEHITSREVRVDVTSGCGRYVVALWIATVGWWMCIVLTGTVDDEPLQGESDVSRLSYGLSAGVAMSFRENLQYLRSSRGLTQERLAVLLGVSRQAISKWESDRAACAPLGSPGRLSSARARSSGCAHQKHRGGHRCD